MNKVINTILNHVVNKMNRKPQTNLLYKLKQYMNHKYGTVFCESKSETLLRDYLRKNYPNVRIYQQQKMGSFRMDFFLPDYDLVIEVDGFHHNNPYYQERDKAKDQFLKERKIKIIRVKANELWNKNFKLNLLEMI